MIQRLKHFISISWIQTIKINFKALPFKEALSLPIVIYKGFKIVELKGKINFNVPVSFGLVGFGQPYEVFTKGGNKGEAVVNGTLNINGRVQFGIDTKVYIKKKAVLTLGHINSFAARTEIICFKKITIEDWVQFGNDCLICDTNFHEVKDVSTNAIEPMNKDIFIGNHNYIGARTTIKGNCYTAPNSIVATNSLLNKDYTFYGENILIGGIPAKKIKDNVTRDWETEKKALENYLTIKL